MWTRRFLILVLVGVFLYSACSSRKHLVSRQIDGSWTSASQEERTRFFNLVDRYQVDFHTVNARAKGLLTFNEEQNHEVNVQLRMIRDESIWISVTAFLGMEMGRLLLTPDRIQVMNRGNRTYLDAPISRLAQMIDVPLDFYEIQHLLLGNVPNDTAVNHWDLGLFVEGGVLRSEESGLRVETHLNQNFRVVSYLNEQEEDAPVSASNTLELNHQYAGEQVDDDSEIHPGAPEKTSLSLIAQALKLMATLDYQRVVVDQPIELPFNIPKGYRPIH